MRGEVVPAPDAFRRGDHLCADHRCGDVPRRVSGRHGVGDLRRANAHRLGAARDRGDCRAIRNPAGADRLDGRQAPRQTLRCCRLQNAEFLIAASPDEGAPNAVFRTARTRRPLEQKRTMEAPSESAPFAAVLVAVAQRAPVWAEEVPPMASRLDLLLAVTSPKLASAPLGGQYLACVARELEQGGVVDAREALPAGSRRQFLWPARPNGSIFFLRSWMVAICILCFDVRPVF